MTVEASGGGRSSQPSPEAQLSRIEGTYARFRLGVESYALPVTHLREVASLRELTVVPGAQPSLIGVWNLRGQILPVVDLGYLLSLEPSGLAKHVLVVELDGQRIGLAVDEVSGVGELKGDAQGRDSALVVATVTGDGEEPLIGILDLRRVYDVLTESVVG
jgi:chemotaxis signal transduction protein